MPRGGSFYQIQKDWLVDVAVVVCWPCRKATDALLASRWRLTVDLATEYLHLILVWYKERRREFENGEEVEQGSSGRPELKLKQRAGR